MFGRSASLVFALFALSLCCPTQAFAKRRNLATGLPIGIGLAAGLEDHPRTDFAAGRQTLTTNYSHYFAFQPYLDLVNVAFRLSLGWHFYPLVSGGGTDTNGNFRESSDAGSFDYGARILLAPFISENFERRAYFVLGVGQSVVKIRNSRTYSSGGLNGRTYSDWVQGTGLQLDAGVGVEFFLIQNYSLQIEGGFRQMNADSFKYRSQNNLSGGTVAEGAEVLGANGRPQAFHTSTIYGQIALNLQL